MVDQIHQERLLKARRQSPEERVAEAMELTDFAFETMENAVKAEHPEADAQAVTAIVRHQLGRLRRREDRHLFQPLRATS